MQTPLLDGLNPEQAQAVTQMPGPVLVVAGPGSGKTRVLTSRVAYLIEEQRVPADRILAVTFTNKAAREMRDRIDRQVGRVGATAGLWMGTFHAMGVRMLRSDPGSVAQHLGILPNFVIYDDTDQQAAAKAAIIAMGQDPKRIAPRRMLSRISAAKGLLLTPAEYAATEVTTYDDEIVARVYEGYDAYLRRANAVDFDDLLSLPIRLFDAAPTVLERYQERFEHILVDEYQDTNRVQYVLVASLASKHRNLFVVGDPDQSIYAWRQADIRNILDFGNDFPDAVRIDLEVNYRSTARIVAAADRVIRENTQRIDRKLRTDNDEGEPIILRELADQDHEASFIVQEIRRFIQREGIRPRDIAIMYRTTAQSRAIEQAFRTSDVRYKIVGGLRFYDRAEVKDVLTALRLIYNPSDQIAFERVVDHFPIGRGLGPKALDALNEWRRANGRTVVEALVAVETPDPDAGSPILGGAARTAAVKLGQVFSALGAEHERLPLVDLFDRLLDETGYNSSFSQESEEDLNRWANVLELRSDLVRFNDLTPETALATYLEQVALIADVDALADEDKDNTVTLITLHSAKGLEFPVVFVTGVEEGLLPISRAIEAETDDPNQIEEERRLFYVGITRAKRLLIITHTGHRMTYGRTEDRAPSRFLANLPMEHVRTISARPSSNRGGSAGLLDRARQAARVDRNGARYDAPKAEVPTYASGQRVFHPQFGEGTITEVVARNDDQELGIEFVRHGKKRLLASFARLDAVSATP